MLQERNGYLLGKQGIGGSEAAAACGKYKINWKNCTRSSVDKDKVPPDIYAAALKITTYRKFEIK